MSLLWDEPAVALREVGVVRVTGPDRLTYLHTLLSQDLEPASPGTAADFLYLDAKGTILAAGRALVRDGDVWLVTPRDVAGDLAAALEKFKFLMQVEAADVSETMAAAAVRGGDADVDGAPPRPMSFTDAHGGVVVRDRNGGIDLVGDRDWVNEQVDALGLPLATAQQYEAWRVAAGDPAWGSEIVPGRRAQELGLLPTHVHLRKGCYPGQESIAKIYNLGRPRRALAVLAVDGPAAAGDPVEAEGKSGEVTSAADTDEGAVVLALVPVDREGAVPTSGVTVAGFPARVVRRVGEGVPQPGA